VVEILGLNWCEGTTPKYWLSHVEVLLVPARSSIVITKPGLS
jgi:hypothetical protein